jgi:hypothetical protein
MNERTAGAALLVIGVVALFAAIVGGGIKIREIEVGSVPSRVRQGLLAAFGLVVGLIGLILVMPDDNTANAADIENIAAADENGADAVDANAAEENADANVAEDANGDSGEARTE